MKKIILKVIAFFIILAILLTITSNIFVPKNNTEEAGMELNGYTQLLGEKENSVDMIVLGNSESFTSIIPMKLWEDCGYTCYICGYPGLFFADTMRILYDSTKNQNPKLVIIEGNIIYDEGPLTIFFSRIIQEILPITEYHDRWKTLDSDDFQKPNYTSIDCMKGFHYKTISKPYDATDYMQYTDASQELSYKSKIYLKIIQAYCKHIGAELMIMSVPSALGWNYEKHNGIEQYAKNNNIRFLDFNLITDELGIDWNVDTIDGGDHMNFTGSTKLTNYFEKYIKQLNILEDHRGDSYYSNWNDDLIKYKEEINREGSGQ